MKDKENILINDPINQTKLYGYDIYFSFFIELFKSKKMHNKILLSGPKGSGKATFAYHFINYLLSKKEENPYDFKNFNINETNSSYKFLCSNIHQNFFLIDVLENDKSIKIDQIRNLITFINKTTYSQNIKIVLIDNVELLNLNSSNAVLKVLEEATDNTYFFLIHNSYTKILETIKSRCTEFKFFFTKEEKEKIFNKILSQYELSNINKKTVDDLYFDTPGNMIRYCVFFQNQNIDFSENSLDFINFLIDNYSRYKNSETLNQIAFFIEMHYNKLSLVKKNFLPNFFYNYSKILNYLHHMKKYNLSDKNVLTSIKNILLYEK